MDQLNFGKIGIANKGATLVQLKIGDTKLAMVNCHLPSGWELPDINKRAQKEDEIIAWIDKDNDAIIWGGDFNLRDYFKYHPAHHYGEKEIEKVMEDMRGKDEIQLYKQNKIIQDGFKHPELDYLPSYRIDLKKDHKKVEYSKERKPAWTDRIFYKVNNEEKCKLSVKGDKYTSDYIKGTDHMPVYGVFEFTYFVKE